MNKTMIYKITALLVAVSSYSLRAKFKTYNIPFVEQASKDYTRSSQLSPEAKLLLDKAYAKIKNTPFLLKIYPGICSQDLPVNTRKIIVFNRVMEIVHYLDQKNINYFKFKVFNNKNPTRQVGKGNCYTKITLVKLDEFPAYNKAEESSSAEQITEAESVVNLYFGYLEYKLSKEEKSKLRAVISSLGSRYKKSKIRIQAHTDPKGSASLNDALSKARGYSAYRIIRKYKFNRQNLSLSYFGEQKILKRLPDESLAQYHKKLRRVELYISLDKEKIEEKKVEKKKIKKKRVKKNKIKKKKVKKKRVKKKRVKKKKIKKIVKEEPKSEPALAGDNYSLGIGGQGLVILGAINKRVANGGGGVIKFSYASWEPNFGGSILGFSTQKVQIK